MQLNEFFKQNPRIAVAFSGGVDSSYLLFAAKEAQCDIHAFFIKSAFQPQFELDEAISIAKNLEIPLTVDIFNILSEQEVTDNTPERCYICKTKILNRLWTLARENGFNVLCDGTNADDDESDRPGMKALREQGVLSPLRICSLDKNEIRKLSKLAGLPTHNKPAYACLATRVPTGTEITRHYLEIVERAEKSLFEMEFSDFRVRIVPPKTAKLQVSGDQWDYAAKHRKEIIDKLGSDFDNIVLDLAERDRG